MKKQIKNIMYVCLFVFGIYALSSFMRANILDEIPFAKSAVVPVANYNMDDSQLKCINKCNPRSPNYIGQGTGRLLDVRFDEANWSSVRNTCGNYVSANKRGTNGKRFTFPDPNLYQYQLVLFEEGPDVRNYFTIGCEEGVSYTVPTKKGFKYYVYTNDTSGDHDDNTGYFSVCYNFR
ncbi:hypothetical protein [uncultured Dokdonia sp.]|uniref:hypothetical protein n=1 Tax=uncultured Dokdonia sp. TaxID=575653 RepID=UPI0026176504|nr:hypothetical protein [uncultured Dokdonia sp.]